MQVAAVSAKPQGLPLLFGRRRVVSTLVTAFCASLPLALGWQSGYMALLGRCIALALMAMLVFGLFEQWPKTLPSWLARWALQVIGVALVMPLGTWFIYVFSTEHGAPAFWHDKDRLGGFFMLAVFGLLLAPWVALAALVRQKDALARHQALAFDLERSELERQALDARLHLLSAQVAPHFLFNTLANVQALVETGSPQAPAVLRSLIAYLRAAVPRLHQAATTLGQEVEMVRAYLELMHMRMPDRLAYSLHADQGTAQLQCPPMTLLTLVENAVRHGIDPSEEGGRIDVLVLRRGERCLIRVSDSGVGLSEAAKGLGTGLANLGARLRLVFGEAALLRVTAQPPRGVLAEVEIPARGAETGARA